MAWTPQQQYRIKRWKWTGWRNPFEGKKPLDPIAPSNAYPFPGGAALESSEPIPSPIGAVRGISVAAKSTKAVQQVVNLSWLRRAPVVADDVARSRLVRTPQVVDEAAEVVKVTSNVPTQPLRGVPNSVYMSGSRPWVGRVATIGAVGGTVAYVGPRAGGWFSSAGQGAGDAAAAAGAGAGAAFRDLFGGLGEGLFNLFGGSLAGAGAGAGEGIKKVGEAVTSVIGPALIVAGIVVGVSVLKK